MAQQEKDVLYVIAASYDDTDAAVADYEAIKALYREVKSSHDFDASVIAKGEDGKVRVVKKHEEPTRHGAAKGLAWGLAVGVTAALFPPVGIGMAAATGAGGAAIGAVAGHASGGMSRGDLKELGDTLDAGQAGLIVVYALINLPIVVWMLYTFFKEVPKDILEAGRMDGAKPKQELVHILMPLSLPGIASTGLLSIILCWNEAFWSLNLTTSQAAPLTTFIASFSSPQGLFWAKLSAASSMAIAPILVFGWMSQKQLVRGLTFGAVK